ncbi:hypothetical protein I4F81_009708 [Pyropia yezoensis]|uniref:Uncharacterized protein n=1 Tax=Pyropia yezoensis TaxID=2788 RepID=A0ACC3CBQ3_PYRYE|nr:hypothetical protein I4F81_009708 [Neopyropia yezoensis]|eukprot:contig_26665_g6559
MANPTDDHGEIPSSLPGAVAASAAASATAATRDEDAACLRLGVMDSDKVEVLMIAEAAALLAKREADHQKLGHTYSLDVVNGLFRPAMNYCTRFDRIQNKTAVLAVRESFDARASELGLHAFEVAQLVNLMPADAEEAKAVIPSLREEGKIDNDVLNSLLMELTTFAK